MLVGGMPFPQSTVIVDNIVLQEFVYTGAAETVVVPSGVTSVTVWLWGGAGGNGNYSSGAWSGGGGFLAATFSCSPGNTLKFEVAGGGQGAARNANGGLGGWPDGGDGGRGDAGSGGGGGSSRFYINNTLKAVAGGGGGSGGFSDGGLAGGGGGTTAQSCSNANGGTGGSQVAGGFDGNNSGNANKTGRSIIAFPGVQRTGGFGSSNGDRTVTSTDDGGGGGGGYWGGGGGGGDAQSGGGGSSWAAGDASNVQHRPAGRFSPAFVFGADKDFAWGVNSGNAGSAVAGKNGRAVAFFGNPYRVLGGLAGQAEVNVTGSEKTVQPVNFAQPVLAKSILVRIGPTGNAGSFHRPIIYSDAGGIPSALVYAGATAVQSPGVNKFMELNLGDLNLPAGTYHFGVHSSDNNRFGRSDFAGSSNYTLNDLYSDGPTSTWGPNLAATYDMSFSIIYLT